jgi:hypothetical protein
MPKSLKELKEVQIELQMIIEVANTEAYSYTEVSEMEIRRAAENQSARASEAYAKISQVIEALQGAAPAVLEDVNHEAAAAPQPAQVGEEEIEAIFALYPHSEAAIARVAQNDAPEAGVEAEFAVEHLVLHIQHVAAPIIVPIAPPAPFMGGIHVQMERRIIEEYVPRVPDDEVYQRPVEESIAQGPQDFRAQQQRVLDEGKEALELALAIRNSQQEQVNPALALDFAVGVAAAAAGGGMVNPLADHTCQQIEAFKASFNFDGIIIMSEQANIQDLGRDDARLAGMMQEALTIVGLDNVWPPVE